MGRGYLVVQTAHESMELARRSAARLRPGLVAVLRLPGREIANALSHGLGLVGSLGAIALLAAVVMDGAEPRHRVAVAIYGTTLVVLYLVSTLYHSVPRGRFKQALRLADHCAIYLLIAGTATPLSLAHAGAEGRTGMLGLVWALALLGVAWKLATRWRHPSWSLLSYLGFAWGIGVAYDSVLFALPRTGLLLFAAGGAAYTLGVVFFVWRRLPYHHAIWHLFVLAGSAFHFAAIAFYVFPAATGA